jgi:hypothetical protein
MASGRLATARSRTISRISLTQKTRAIVPCRVFFGFGKFCEIAIFLGVRSREEVSRICERNFCCYTKSPAALLFGSGQGHNQLPPPLERFTRGLSAMRATEARNGEGSESPAGKRTR